MARLLPVECANCGWKGKRASGKIVECPDCGQIAAFQVSDLVRGNHKQFKATMDALEG